MDRYIEKKKKKNQHSVGQNMISKTLLYHFQLGLDDLYECEEFKRLNSTHPKTWGFRTGIQQAAPKQSLKPNIARRNMTFMWWIQDEPLKIVLVQQWQWIPCLQATCRSNKIDMQWAAVEGFQASFHLSPDDYAQEHLHRWEHWGGSTSICTKLGGCRSVCTVVCMYTTWYHIWPKLKNKNKSNQITGVMRLNKGSKPKSEDWLILEAACSRLD